MQIKAQASGVKELSQVFAKMPAGTRRRASRPALRKGAAVIRKAAADNIKQVADKGYATGLGARSIRIYAMKPLRGALRVGVMVRKGLLTVKGIRVGLYLSVLEYGKKNQPPRSWIRKAKREKESQAISVVTSELAKNLEAAVKDAKK